LTKNQGTWMNMPGNLIKPDSGERGMTMCPCLSSKSRYATCGRFGDGLMVPSVFERENYCFALYELCPLFCGSGERNYTERIGTDLEPANMGRI
jgi:hypothetical protein